MKRMLVITLFLCGVSSAVFGMDYKRIAGSTFTGAAAGAFAPTLMPGCGPKRLLKENPEAYAAMIFFGGVVGFSYGIVSSPIKHTVVNKSKINGFEPPLRLSQKLQQHIESSHKTVCE